MFLILAEWIEIGGKNYDINIAPLTQSEARARCIRFGGKLFEPKDAKTNKDVFLQAGTLTHFLSIQSANCPKFESNCVLMMLRSI